jgi:hypothetical protein
MSDAIHAMRSDLAFLKAVTEDRGPVPAILGWHLIAIGGVFGIAFIHIWAVYAGLLPWPKQWEHLLALPGTLAYLPVNAWISIRGRGTPMGPSARVFGAAWGAMAVMNLVAVAVIVLAGARAKEPFYLIWPALALVLYGGAWIMIAMIRRRLWNLIVAAGCFACAMVAALLVGRSVQWLLMAGVFFALIGAPGVAIVRAARRAG